MCNESKIILFLDFCLKNYNKKDVMKRALPIAVKFLHKGNRELSRNMAPYLSLAAIDNADLLSKHIQLIIDSIISGKFLLFLWNPGWPLTRGMCNF